MCCILILFTIGDLLPLSLASYNNTILNTILSKKPLPFLRRVLRFGDLGGGGESRCQHFWAWYRDFRGRSYGQIVGTLRHRGFYNIIISSSELNKNEGGSNLDANNSKEYFACADLYVGVTSEIHSWIFWHRRDVILSRRFIRLVAGFVVCLCEHVILHNAILPNYHGQAIHGLCEHVILHNAILRRHLPP